MPRPHEIVITILERVGLHEPDGRMLCKYRCTDDEYIKLQEALYESIKLCHGVVPQTEEQGMPAFCLYASEWWRRNYDSGPWKYSGILESVGLDPDYTRTYLYYPITMGLRFWKRRLLNVGDRRAFFITLACEGGLPLRLIYREDDSHLRRYLRDLLREFRVYGVSAVSPFELASRIGSALPRGMQQKPLFQLCGELIERVWQLQSQLGDTITPIEDLDRTTPNWRDTFPLVVSDDAAQALINSLLKSAIKIARIQEIQFASILNKTSSGFQLERKIRLPSYFDARSLAAILEMDVQNLPYRIQIYLNQATGSRVLLGLVTRRIGGDEGRFAIEYPHITPIILKDEAAEEQVWLDVRSGNLNLELRNIKGSLGLSDLPWVFAARGDTANQYELIGEGSLKTKFSEILLVVNPEAEIQQIDPDGSLVSEGNVLDRTIYRVTGTVVVSCNGNRSTIYTKSEEEESAQYVLSGELLSSGTFGSSIYLGFPRIMCFSNSGAVTNILPERMQWKTKKGNDPWKTNLKDCYGPVKIRFSPNGETRFMANIDVVPSGSSINFKPGINVRAGSIEIKGMNASEYATSQPQFVQVTKTPIIDGCLLECVSSEEPPAKLIVHMRWPLGQELSLQVPYPAKGVRFINRDGNILKTDEKVHISKMSGVLVQVMELNPHVNYFVDASIIAKNISGIKQEGLKLTEVAHGRHEIDLRQLQEGCNLLFSAVADLDAWIRIGVTSSAGTSFPHKIYIARYDMALEPDKELGEVLFSEDEIKSAGNDLINIELKAFPLINPSFEPELLPKLADGRWAFGTAGRKPGPWLITGWDGDWCRVRPLCWTVLDETEPAVVLDESNLSLENVVKISEQSNRLSACHKLLDVLAEDPGNLDWKKIEAYFRHMRHLPPNAFDVIVKMARHHIAAPTALLRVGEDLFDDVWTGLERLPFAWYLVPVESWLRSAKIRAEFLSATLAPLADTLGEDVRTIVERSFKSFFDQAPVRVLGLQPVIELMKNKLFKEPIQQLQYLNMVCNRANRQMLKEMCIMGAMQGLLQLHSEDNWPVCHELSEEWWPLHSYTIPEELHELWFKETAGIGYRSAVLDAPIVAAYVAAFAIKLPKKLVFHVRRMREFDTAWFDTAYGCALAICIGYRLENEQEFI